MAKVIWRKVKGKEYAYLEESLRIGDKIKKISTYLGPKDKITDKIISEAKVKMEDGLLDRKVDLKLKQVKDNVLHLEYPLTLEEVRKIEKMNFKYKKIIQKLHPKDKEDLYKRFIANYVFESNALEGNSLTLKNVAEILFDKRMSKDKDLREIYDAQNSYALFKKLLRTEKDISHEFIISIHKQLMNKIDDRLGYRTVPIILLGKPRTELASPEQVPIEMNKLLIWYEENKNKSYPLELAFKFHAKFEKIHPFCDGNGRAGRFMLNYILIKDGYFPIIIRKTHRNTYLKALEAADRDKWIVLMRFALIHYKDTFRKFFEIYYQYAK